MQMGERWLAETIRCCDSYDAESLLLGRTRKIFFCELVIVREFVDSFFLFASRQEEVPRKGGA